MRKATDLATLLLATALLPACSALTDPDGTPTRKVVSQNNWDLEVGSAFLVDVNVTTTGGGSGRTGTLDATVNWTSSTNNVDIYVTAMSCTTQMFAVRACTYLTKADSTTAKPERVSFTVSPGTYRLWIVNLGPTKESGTIEVGLTQ